MQACPCGSKQNYQNCCGQYLEGDNPAPNPEALMRSRYTAYTKANIDYIMATAKTGDDDFDADAAKQWAQSAKWYGLEIVKADKVTTKSKKSFVEFIAHYEIQNQAQSIHENSEFEKIDGRWYYISGQDIEKPNASKSAPKVGRNDPCPCGSGKKYKKCCWAKG